MIDKKRLSERDICTKFITPALKDAGWDIQTQVREEVTFTAGKILVRGNVYARGKKKRADYILYYTPDLPIAVIEAKDNNRAVSEGIQQALEYSRTLDLPFVYSSNGDAFYEHDKTLTSGDIEREVALDKFPSPQELWERYKKYKGIESEAVEKVITEEYYTDPSGREPRYYQTIAINRTAEAIAKGQNRVLLVMATGTGKTYTAFQVAWKLYQSGLKKRILFLADRTALIDQARRGDFKHFKDKMTVIKKKVVKEEGGKETLVSNKKKGIDTADKAFEVFLGLYQGLTNHEGIEDAYKDFSPDFFDLVIVDECHRGSAAENSSWRQILDYFKTATHIGLTATPKETADISNAHYFGEAVYTYSLKQGIADGFLAPYKVVRVGLDIDKGWTPPEGFLDKTGKPVEIREYNSKDFDVNIVVEERTELVAKKITEFLEKTDRYAKTIVFCVDIEHATRMRNALARLNAGLMAENHKYVMQITGDNEEGKRELDNFTDPEQKYPVIAVTSKLMTTGVDAQTCKLIVLDNNIQSMTEFKQIIGRGTRVRTDFGKYYFTIMDFRNVTKLFKDPDFDGEPVVIYEPGENENPVPPDPPVDSGDGNDGEEIDGGGVIIDPPFGGDDNTGGGGKREKVYVNNVEVSVVNERVEYYGPDGKLITESLKDFTKNNILREFRSLDDFLQKWNSAEKKQEVITELQERGILLYELQDVVGLDLDPFDLVCHVAFNKPALTRRERALNVKKRDYFTKYGDKAMAVIDALLEKYSDKGIESIESGQILKLEPLNKIGTPAQIAKLFGGADKFRQAVKELEDEIYRSA